MIGRNSVLAVQSMWGREQVVLFAGSSAANDASTVVDDVATERSSDDKPCGVPVSR